ncbi:MAG: Uma2 family endonuclease [Pedosphaera sp.]|nr:Uma2 family endonuclease [Pedosphaera sp.]
MAAREPIRKLTQQEYLEVERRAHFKSEFFDGEMFAMAGGTPHHSLIATNLAREFGNALKGRPCIPYNADLRVKIEATGLFTYPDLSVVCGPLEFAPGTDDTIINPTLIIEVLSDSTEAYDRGKKFEHYRQIRSLKEYVLVSQKEPKMEIFTRQADDRWLLSEASDLEVKFEITSLGIAVSPAEVFANVKFVSNSIRTGLSPSR